MSDDQEFSSSRRKFLGGAAVATGALATGQMVHAQAAGPDPLITELQPWQQYLGDGVDARPTGCRPRTRRMWCVATCPG
jgi:sulfane dehydrogenase subunit SoxC